MLALHEVVISGRVRQPDDCRQGRSDLWLCHALDNAARESGMDFSRKRVNVAARSNRQYLPVGKPRPKLLKTDKGVMGFFLLVAAGVTVLMPYARKAELLTPCVG